MGSCIAIPARAYAAVRGFPRKNAAEDFYVLDKLAKVGTISRLSGSPLLLEGRISDRVPFGTGQGALAASTADAARSRNSASTTRRFRAPGRVASRPRRRRGLGRRRLDAAIDGAPAGQSVLPDRGARRGPLDKIGAFAAIAEAIARSNDPQTLRRHLHTWFDAFRTLKLIHALRDGGLPSLALARGARGGALHRADVLDGGGPRRRCAGPSPPGNGSWPPSPRA